MWRVSDLGNVMCYVKSMMEKEKEIGVMVMVLIVMMMASKRQREVKTFFGCV